MKSLLEQLPSIVAEGKKEAERVMERAESNYRLGLQTRELVVPSRDSNWQDMFRQKPLPVVFCSRHSLPKARSTKIAGGKVSHEPRSIHFLCAGDLPGVLSDRLALCAQAFSK
jgi:CTP:molybdopterin cytidylyltransferase MocA